MEELLIRRETASQAVIVREIMVRGDSCIRRGGGGSDGGLFL